MEKLILAIIILNVLASIIVKNRKKKQAQKAAQLQSRSEAKPPADKKKQEVYSRGPASGQPQKLKIEPSPAVKKSVTAGRNILDEVAKELGLNLKIQEEPPPPEPEPEFQEQLIIDETVVPYTPPRKPKKPGKAPKRHMKKEDSSPAWISYGEREAPLTKKPKSRMERQILEPLTKSESVRQAFILKTILDQPLAMRGRRLYRY